MENSASPLVKKEAVKISKSSLPEELILDIISRLPVKSVFRAQCLSKNFLSITTDPHFVKAHLRNSARIRPSIIINTLNLLYLIRCSSEHSDCTVEKIPLHQDIQFSNKMKVVASCDGLVVIIVGDNSDDCFLCNPTTNQCNHLPPASRSGPDAKFVSLAWGFGYCEESAVYKIVRLIYFCLEDDNCIKFIKMAEVFSCGTDQSWRRLDFNKFTMNFWNGITVKDVVYWDDGDSQLLVFDLAKEEFSRIRVPGQMNRTIMNFDGSLAICHLFGIGTRRTVDIWIMKDKHFASDSVCCFVDGDSWEKIYTSAEFPPFIPYALRLNDRSLFLGHGESTQCEVLACSSYDLERKVIKRIPEISISTLAEVHTFVESLVDPLYPSQSTSSYARRG